MGEQQSRNIMDYDTVRLDDENNAVVIIDQTKLPGKIEIISLHTAQEIWNAIYLLQVRGAPAIGVAAAYGIYVLAKRMDTGITIHFTVSLYGRRSIWILRARQL